MEDVVASRNKSYPPEPRDTVCWKPGGSITPVTVPLQDSGTPSSQFFLRIPDRKGPVSVQVPLQSLDVPSKDKKSRNDVLSFVVIEPRVL